MQNKKIVFLGLVLTLMFCGQGVRAEEIQKIKSSSEAEAVSIYNAKIVSQNKNNIKLKFDLVNGKGIQAGVNYVIQLTRRLETGGQVILDEKKYTEKLFFNENETIEKEVEYIAPEYLNGKFIIWLTSKNQSGMLLGLNGSLEVSLAGNNQYIEIIPESCYIKVEGEVSNKKYTLRQGVDIKSDEKLIAYCDVVNHFDLAKVFTPKFQTYWRSTSGELVDDNQEKQPALSLASQEKRQIYFVLPKANAPQAYDATLVLNDEFGKTISNQIVAHYVLHGQSATIQNFNLDKDYYNKGENAKLSIQWTPSADGFVGSRLGATKKEDMLARFMIKDAHGNRCIEDSVLLLSAFEMDFDLAIINDCIDPSVSVEIQNKAGNVFDKKEVSFKSESFPEIAKKENDFFRYKIQMLIFILLSVVLAFIFVRKRKGVLVLVLFYAIFSTNNTSLASWSWGECVSPCTPLPYDYNPCSAANMQLCLRDNTYTDTLQAQGWLNKQVYVPNELAFISGTVIVPVCGNDPQYAFLGVRITNDSEYANVVPGKEDTGDPADSLIKVESSDYSGMLNTNSIQLNVPNVPGTYTATHTLFAVSMQRYDWVMNIVNQIEQGTFDRGNDPTLAAYHYTRESLLASLVGSVSSVSTTETYEVKCPSDKPVWDSDEKKCVSNIQTTNPTCSNFKVVFDEQVAVSNGNCKGHLEWSSADADGANVSCTINKNFTSLDTPYLVDSITSTTYNNYSIGNVNRIDIASVDPGTVSCELVPKNGSTLGTTKCSGFASFCPATPVVGEPVCDNVSLELVSSGLYKISWGISGGADRVIVGCNNTVKSYGGLAFNEMAVFGTDTEGDLLVEPIDGVTGVCSVTACNGLDCASTSCGTVTLPAGTADASTCTLDLDKDPYAVGDTPKVTPTISTGTPSAMQLTCSGLNGSGMYTFNSVDEIIAGSFGSVLQDATSVNCSLDLYDASGNSIGSCSKSATVGTASVTTGCGTANLKTYTGGTISAFGNSDTLCTGATANPTNPILNASNTSATWTCTDTSSVVSDCFASYSDCTRTRTCHFPSCNDRCGETLYGYCVVSCGSSGETCAENDSGVICASETKTCDICNSGKWHER